jgi:hypothetical protein
LLIKKEREEIFFFLISKKEKKYENTNHTNISRRGISNSASITSPPQRYDDSVLSKYTTETGRRSTPNISTPTSTQETSPRIQQSKDRLQHNPSQPH